MKPVLLNTYDWGGAGIATRRILDGLRKIGVDATMLVQHSRSDDPKVVGPESHLRRAYSVGRIATDSLPSWLYREREGNFSFNWLPDDINRQLQKLNPDIVHLNWIGEGFFRVKSIGEMPAPVVWRLPDMWAFTGGCHYSGDCNKYKDRCGACPRLGSNRERDVSRWTWKRKAESWREKEITIVAPSTWLAEVAGESSLFSDRRIEVIPNALDTSVFQPVEATEIYDRFNLDSEKKIVLFGAQFATSDPRKGFDLVQESLIDLSERHINDDVQLVVFGGSEPNEEIGLPIPVTYVGYIQDNEDLVKLYSAADVMVVPSRYEGFGQTVSEALACATPVVAFDASGPRDIVDHQESGYLAEPYDSSDLANGIAWVLEDEARRKRLGENGRDRATNRYSDTRVAEQYRELYSDLIN